MEDLVNYFNGIYQPASKILLPIDNIGFTRGYAAFECYRTYGRAAFRLKDHVKRLKNTCEKLLISFPEEDLFSITETLIEKNPGSELIFRIYVIDSIESKGYLLAVLCNTRESFAKTHPSKPLHLKTVLDCRENKSIKSTSYSKSMVEIKKAQAAGFDDILYVGEDNYIHELSRANFFAVKGKTLYTPKHNFLPGITRLAIIEMAHDCGYKVEIEDIDLAFLSDAEEVFGTATIRGIAPIERIDTLTFTSSAAGNALLESFKNLAYNGSQKAKHLCSSHS